MIATPPTLEVFYANTCAPCRLELPALKAFLESPHNRLRIVLVTGDSQALADIGAISKALSAVTTKPPATDPRAILRAAGNSDGILPYARAIMEDGTICARWRGTLTITRINNLLSACGRFNEPHSPRS